MSNPSDYTISEFQGRLALGQYTSHGNYAMYFFTNSWECICFKCAEKEKENIVLAIQNQDNSSKLQVIGADINWEDSTLYCNECGERIESAYGEEE